MSFYYEKNLLRAKINAHKRGNFILRGYMKTVKIIVNILMLVFIVLSVVRWDGNATYHIVVGSSCALFFTIHFLLNRKLFIGLTRKFFKLSKKIKLQYIIDLLLIIVWCITIITGFIAIRFYIGEAETTFKIGRFHGIMARVGCGFAVVHTLQHLKQIRSYFKHVK